MRYGLTSTSAAIILVFVSFTATPIFADQEPDERQPALRIDAERLAQPATLSDRQAVTAAEERVRRVSGTQDVARFQFSSQAIDTGRVVAVQGTRAEVVTANNIADKIAADAIFVENLRPSVTKTAAPDALDAGQAVVADFKLSFQVTAVDALTAEPVKLDAWARDSTGLTAGGDRAFYAGDFHVALTNANDPNDRSLLVTPVPVAITAIGATSIEPRPLTIEQLGQWHDVSIVVPSVDSATYPIAVSADPSSVGDAIELSVTHPTIRIWATPSSIIGWGIGQATVNVAASDVRLPEGLPIPITSTFGNLDAGTVVLDAFGHATVGLRSSRHAGTTVEINRSGIISDPLPIRFDAPWLFLGAAIAGGLIGAFLRGRGRQHWVRAGAIGALTAVVMTLAYAVGVDWPARVLDSAGIARAGEAVVFVLGAVGALIGVSWLVPSRQNPLNGGR